MGSENVYEFTGLVALLVPLGAELLFRGAILGHLTARRYKKAVVRGGVPGLL